MTQTAYVCLFPLPHRINGGLLTEANIFVIPM